MKKVFIDCGGHDGCSVLKFLSSRPDYACYTFEPNPLFSRYYRWLPTKLQTTAVAAFDGRVQFTLDPIDGDGSSIHPNKRVDFTGKVENKECPSLMVRCVDLIRFIEGICDEFDYLVLKLDVEGAEYGILSEMLTRGTLPKIDELFCEFHWDRIGMERAEHEALVQRVQKLTRLRHWDAAEWAVHGKDGAARRLRVKRVVRMWMRRTMYWLAADR